MEPNAEPKVGYGEACLNFSRHGPWSTLPIKKVYGAQIVSGQLFLQVVDDKYYTEIDPEAYLPYSYSAWDDLPDNELTRT